MRAPRRPAAAPAERASTAATTTPRTPVRRSIISFSAASTEMPSTGRM
jgi:hypothetical protein